jgi:polyisoprenoid-binding protein YceI
MVVPSKENMMARPRFVHIWPALVALTVAFSADAGGKCRMHDKEKPSVKFSVGGPAGLKIDGSSKDLTVEDDGSKIVLKAAVTNLETGMGLRNKHLKKYIGAEQWPAASLTVDKSAIKMPGEGTATGQFRLHGVTKEKTFKYKVKKDGSNLEVSGSFEVDITEHNIEKPCYLGVCTDTKVKVTASFKAVDS